GGDTQVVRVAGEGLRGVGGCGGVLRADLARHVERQERIALAEQVRVAGAELAAQRVDEDELAFPAGAVLDTPRALRRRQSGDLGIEFFDRREASLSRRVGGRQDCRGCGCGREGCEAPRRLATYRFQVASSRFITSGGASL